MEQHGIMYDIETLDVEGSAVVVQVAAVLFNLNKREIVDTVNIHFDFQGQIDSGRSISRDTLLFWLRQPKEAIEAVFFPDHLFNTDDGIRVLLMNVERWQRDNDVIEHWANGDKFDITVLESLFLDQEEETPWKFYELRDLRTIKKYCVPPEFKYSVLAIPRVAHDALSDAMAQCHQYYDIAAFIGTRNLGSRNTFPVDKWPLPSIFNDGPIITGCGSDDGVVVEMVAFDAEPDLIVLGKGSGGQDGEVI